MTSSATKPWFSSVHHFLFYFIHTQDEVGSVEAQLLKAEMASFQVSTLKLWPGKARLWQKSSTVSSLKISPLLQPSHSHHPIPIGSLSTINTPPPLRTPYSIKIQFVIFKYISHVDNYTNYALRSASFIKYN